MSQTDHLLSKHKKPNSNPKNPQKKKIRYGFREYTQKTPPLKENDITSLNSLSICL